MSAATARLFVVSCRRESDLLWIGDPHSPDEGSQDLNNRCCRNWLSAVVARTSVVSAYAQLSAIDQHGDLGVGEREHTVYTSRNWVARSSVVDLKFLTYWWQARLGTSNPNTTLESIYC